MFSFIFYNWEVLEGENVGVIRFDLAEACFIYSDDFIVNFFVFKAESYIIMEEGSANKRFINYRGRFFVVEMISRYIEVEYQYYAEDSCCNQHYDYLVYEYIESTAEIFFPIPYDFFVPIRRMMPIARPIIANGIYQR